MRHCRLCPELMRSCWRFRAAVQMAEPALSKVAAGAGGAAVSRQGLALLRHKLRSCDKLLFVVSLSSSAFQLSWLLVDVSHPWIWFLGAGNTPGLVLGREGAGIPSAQPRCPAFLPRALCQGKASLWTGFHTQKGFSVSDTAEQAQSSLSSESWVIPFAKTGLGKLLNLFSLGLGWFFFFPLWTEAVWGLFSLPSTFPADWAAEKDRSVCGGRNKCSHFRRAKWSKSPWR